jgi:hypothetical protein
MKLKPGKQPANAAVCHFLHGLAGNVPAPAPSSPARFLSIHLHDAQDFCTIAHAKWAKASVWAHAATGMALADIRNGISAQTESA